MTRVNWTALLRALCLDWWRPRDERTVVEHLRALPVTEEERAWQTARWRRDLVAWEQNEWDLPENERFHR